MREKAYKLVALVGRPNVGKSSLFNRITKTGKAIVDSMPGVTRDRHYGRVSLDETAFMLVDTGGIEIRNAKNMSTLISEQTWQAVDEADIILFMLDGKEGLTSEDYTIADLLRKSEKPIFCIVNKIDNPNDEEKYLAPFFELGFPHLWPVSSAHGFGVKTFLESVGDYLGESMEVEDDVGEETISIAFIGRPNVGKSSLINRLLGQDRMVVSDMPGTTRDSVDTLLERNGKSYLLIDTAGIRRKGKVKEKVEKFSVLRALATMEKCDLAIVVIDAAEGITDQDAKVVGYSLERGRACLILINKWDLLQNKPKEQKWILDDIERATRFVGFAPTIRVSALTGKGMHKLLPTVWGVYEQYCSSFSTSALNKILRSAVEAHTPPMVKGKRLRFYYATQIATKQPTFLIFVNYPKEVHFSYHRYLTNQFRTGLGLDKSPLRVLFRERKRR